jgi:hypothetical protein
VETTVDPRRRFSAAVAEANDFINPTEMNAGTPSCKRTTLGRARSGGTNPYATAPTHSSS